MKFITLVCNNCNKYFERRLKDYNYSIKKGKTIFVCSLSCRGSITKPCANCGIIVTRMKGRFNRNKFQNIFCSRKCSCIYNSAFKLRENHPNWTNGAASYKAYKKNNCCDCQESRSFLLVVHHKDKDRKNGNEDNLVTLCYNCHACRHLQKVNGTISVNLKKTTSEELRIELFGN